MTKSMENSGDTRVQARSPLGEMVCEHGHASERISLLDLLLLLLERKRLIAVVMALVSISAVVGSGFLTKYYTATAVILPAKSSMQLPGGLGSLMDNLPLSGMLKSLNTFSNNNNDQMLSILKSRKLAERVIEEFELERRYGFHKQKKWYYESLLKAYYESLEVEESELGNITVAYTDTNPSVASRITNYIVGQLDTITYELAKRSARNSRLFFEERLRSIEHDMDSAHDRFNQFRMRHGYLNLETQLNSTIEALAKVEAQKMALDLKIAQLQNRYGSTSNRMAELRRDRAVLINRIDRYMKEGGGRLIIALDSTPQLGVEYAHLYRDVKVQETLYTMVLQMYEQARFREVNNTPVVEVLEYARIPEKKRRPKRAILCILAFSLSFVGICSFVLFQEWYRRQRAEQTLTYRKLHKALGHLRFWK